MKYRIKEDLDKLFYPQYKHSWWPFWLYYENDHGFSVNYRKKSDAENYLQDAIKYPIYHDCE